MSCPLIFLGTKVLEIVLKSIVLCMEGAFEVKKWLSFDFFGGFGYANIKYNLDTSNGF